MPECGTNIAQDKLATIPYPTSGAVDNGQSGRGSREHNVNQPRTSGNITIAKVLLVADTFHNAKVHEKGRNILGGVFIRVVEQVNDNGGGTPVHSAPHIKKPHTLFSQSSEGMLLRVKRYTDDVQLLLDCLNSLEFPKDGCQNFIPGFAGELFTAVILTVLRCSRMMNGT